MASATGGGQVRSSQPISAYPLFPAFVALWFGALFGLSSIAVGTVNLERAASALQLHLLVPAAAPPLGMTARALIALAMTGLGGLVGLAIARLVVRANRPAAEAPPVTVRARDTHPDAPIRRPISAHEEFGAADELDDDATRDMTALRASLKESQAEAFGLPIGEGAARIASADLQELAPVELLERLAIAMQNRLDRRAAEVVDEPEPTGTVTIFPSAPPPKSPEETEKALRDALAALQRMTGAA